MNYHAESAKVAINHGPEIRYDDTLPEAINGSEKEITSETFPSVATRTGWSKKTLAIAVLSILVVVVVVVASVVGSTKAKNSKTDSSSQSSLSRITVTSTMISR